MQCDKCGKKTLTQKIVVDNIEINQWCAHCIVEDHMQFMRRHKCDLLYLYNEKGGDTPTHVTDFSCHHKIPLTRMRVSDHNFAGKRGRIDLWFVFEDRVWHGVHVGFNNTHVTCRETKRKG